VARFEVCTGYHCARPVNVEQVPDGKCSKCRAGLGIPTWHAHLVNGTWGTAFYMFDLPNLAKLVVSGGVSKKTLGEMTQNEITFLCEAVLSSIVPETDPEVLKSYWEQKQETHHG
jgi:hypothetical protein